MSIQTAPSAKTWIWLCIDIPASFAVCAHDGTVIDIEPENAAAWMPTAPRYKRERPEPVGATGAAKPQAAETQPLDDDLLLVIEDPDPWAHDNEPIFWTD